MYTVTLDKVEPTMSNADSKDVMSSADNDIEQTHQSTSKLELPDKSQGKKIHKGY